MKRKAFKPLNQVIMCPENIPTGKKQNIWILSFINAFIVIGLSFIILKCSFIELRLLKAALLQLRAEVNLE